MNVPAETHFFLYLCGQVPCNPATCGSGQEPMHPFSSLTIGIFVAGYITARWDLVTRLYELSIFAWDHGVVVRDSDREMEGY